MLQDPTSKNPLNIREDKYNGIFVEGLTEYIISNAKDWYALLKRGEKNRVTRQTKININSSRSHSIFQLWLETETVDSRGMLKKAKLNLCDLAGSEKINKDEEMEAKHLLELKTINLSLTTLGKVISALSKKNKISKIVMKSADSFKKATVNNYTPYRESKLTRLLQDSLGGNTKTCLIATVSPIKSWIEETISTLKFADRAKEVMSVVKANEVNASDDALVQKLQKEVQHLREVLNLRRKGKRTDIEGQLIDLKNENLKLREIASNAQEVERLKLENKIMKLELQKIRYDVEMGSNKGSEESLTSTDMTNGKLLGMKDSMKTKQSIQKVFPNLDTHLPDRCPLWNSFPPCDHYAIQGTLESLTPLLAKKEERKFVANEEREVLNSTKQASRRYEMDDGGSLYKSHQVFDGIPDSLDKHMPSGQKEFVMKSYVDSNFVSPKSISGSMSVPFNFQSDNDIQGNFISHIV